MPPSSTLRRSLSPFSSHWSFCEFQEFLLDEPWPSILSHPLLSRLQDIRHYGLWALFNEDANHWLAETSRLDHSLNVALATYVRAQGLSLSTRERDAVVLAALMHDIAHPPLSHSFEKLFWARGGWDHNHVASQVTARVLADVGVPRDTIATTVEIVRREHVLSRIIYGHEGTDSLENVLRGLLAIGELSLSLASRALEPCMAEDDICTRWLIDSKQHLYENCFYDPRFQIFESLMRTKLLSHWSAPSYSGKWSDPLKLTDQDVIPIISNAAQTALDLMSHSKVITADGPPPENDESMVVSFTTPGRHITVTRTHGIRDRHRYQDVYLVINRCHAPSDSIGAVR